jgi:hypothetical protein
MVHVARYSGWRQHDTALPSMTRCGPVPQVIRCARATNRDDAIDATASAVGALP